MARPLRGRRSLVLPQRDPPASATSLPIGKALTIDGDPLNRTLIPRSRLCSAPYPLYAAVLALGQLRSRRPLPRLYWLAEPHSAAAERAVLRMGEALSATQFSFQAMTLNAGRLRKEQMAILSSTLLPALRMVAPLHSPAGTSQRP